jgi:hypothetical protein
MEHRSINQPNHLLNWSLLKMKFSPETPRKDRAIQQDLYEADGQPDFVFSIARPFSPEHFEYLREELGIDPIGFANGANQLFAENMGNNMAARIKAVAKRNEELLAAQAEGRRTNETLEHLPSQEDMEALMASYDFSGVRVSTGESSALSPVQREMYALSKKLIRAILRAYGTGSKPAPVTVAKADTEPGPSQISADEFAEIVDAVVEGTGLWADGPYAAKRQELIEQAEANVAATRLETADKSLTLAA